MKPQDLSIHKIETAIEKGFVLPEGWTVRVSGRKSNDTTIRLYLDDLHAATLSEVRYTSHVYFQAEDPDFQKTVMDILTRMHNRGKVIIENECAEFKAKSAAEAETHENALLTAFRKRS
jgi:hypothetical protein